RLPNLLYLSCWICPLKPGTTHHLCNGISTVKDGGVTVGVFSSINCAGRYTFQQDNDPKQANTMQECLRDDSVNIECPSQSPDLNPIKHLWRDLKMSIWLCITTAVIQP
uniref:Tc1-like transposase DDE domain-containing protein n=1 Tax=Sinocyclocheilus anshuiensis TaxID=1608454 RepID=A0A671K114_9TELE